MFLWLMIQLRLTKKELAKIYLSGTLNNFVYNNYLDHEKEFNSFKTPKDFQEKYKVDATTLNDFKNYAAKDSIKYNLEDAKRQTAFRKAVKFSYRKTNMAH